MSNELIPPASNTFERIKQVRADGAEFWSARDLARVLEYSVFRNFQPVIDKAKEACARSGHAVADHFAEIRNMVDIGSGAQREVEDWALSRYPPGSKKSNSMASAARQPNALPQFGTRHLKRVKGEP
jgi:DNA-damage-inducible protein D